MTTQTETFSALLVGGPTLAFRYAGLSFVTDPTFDPAGGVYEGGVTLRKLTGPAVAPADLGEVDVVLLSHDQHADNLDTAGREFLASVDTVFSTVDAAARIDGVQGLVAWDTAKLDGPAGQITVTAVPALHGPEGCEPISGVVIGFVLQAEGKLTVYISGDNAAVDRVQDIVDRIGRIDIAVLFTGAANPGRYGDTDVTLNARTAVAAARILADAVVIPIHAEGWAHFSETLERLAREFDYAGLASRLRIPSPGERFTV